MTRNNSATRPMTIACMAALMVLSTKNLPAQQWQLVPDISFSTVSTGLPLADTAVAAHQLLQARSGAYLKLGYGLSLQRHYYLLIPERETALQLFGGLEQFSFVGTDAAARELNRSYLRFGVDQILAGDRTRDNRFLMLSLHNASRWVKPKAASGAADTAEAFFTHTPSLHLSFKLAQKPDFWQVLGLAGSIATTLESGHQAGASPWAFLTGRADTSFSLPIFGRWLYLEAEAAAGAVLHDFSPLAESPAWYYTDYRNPVWLSGQANLKSRILKTNPMVPLAVELGAGIGGRLQGNAFQDIDFLTIEPEVRFFADLAVDSNPQFAFRLRGGVSWQLASSQLGFFIIFL